MASSRKTASGFDENLAGALCYGLGWVTGLVFFATEPENSFVRFHAMQSMLVFAIAIATAQPFLPGQGVGPLGAHPFRHRLLLGRSCRTT